MGPGDVRAQVDTGDHVGIIQRRPQTVAPGEVGEEAVVLTPASAVRIFRDIRRASTVCGRALTEQRVATELGFPISAANTADVVSTHLTYQGKAARSHDPIDKMHSTHGSLPELFTFIALNVIARAPRITPVCSITQTQCTGERRTAHVARVDLNWHIRAIAQFTSYRHPTDIRSETHAV